MPDAPAGARTPALPSTRGKAELFGRQRELVDLLAEIRRSPLVTLTGPGGVGKTRIAIEVARRASKSYRGNVWFATLEEVLAPELVATAVCDELGITLGAGSAVAAIVDFIGPERALLVLDNCEHLLPAAAALVSALLDGCPQLSVLATSRRPLAVDGEVIRSVPPLSSRADDTDAAIELFLDRARAHAPGVEFADDRETLRSLCERLDGLPLAIELAAARTVVFSPRDMLTRLEETTRILRHVRPAHPARHSGLDSSMSWSYSLCTASEQDAWARLAVFKGAFTLEAAEAVLAGMPAEDEQPVDLLHSLVSNAILETDVKSGSVVFRMLQTTRQFGRQQLSAPELRHHELLLIDYAARFGRSAAAAGVTSAQDEWSRRARPELATLREGLEIALALPDARALLPDILLLPFRPVWWANGWITEIAHWYRRVLEVETEPTALRAYVLASMGAASQVLPDPADRDYLAAAQEISDVINDPALSLYVLGCVALARLLGGDWANALETAELGIVATANFPRSPRHLDFMQVAADAADVLGSPDRAVHLAEEMIAKVHGSGDSWYHSLALRILSIHFWRTGDLELAHVNATRALQLARTHEGRAAIIAALQTMVFVLSAMGDDDRAATVLGANEANRYAILASRGIFDNTGENQRTREQLHWRLGERRFAEALEAGAAASVSDIIALALGETAQLPRPASSSSIEGGQLTRRETEVAALVGRGASNREIAQALVISQRTAEGHVDRILGKLGLSSRTQLATWILSGTDE